jgi:hypothetical protein
LYRLLGRFLSDHVFLFWRFVSFLPGGFSEHVFPDYMFESSSLIFIGTRVLLLETCIVLAVFSEHVFPNYTFVSCSLVFFEARAPGVPVLLLNACPVYAGSFSGAPVLI